MVLQYLKGAYKIERVQHFTWADSDRTRKNGFKLKQRSIKKNFFTWRVVRHRLPREAVDAPSLEMLKARLDGSMGSLSAE